MLAGDLNGDGTADIFWRYTDGTVLAWLMDPGLAVSSIASFTGAGNQYTVKRHEDLNGDGKQDMLWQHTDGAVQAWIMNGLGITSIATLARAGTYVIVPQGN